MIFWDTSALLSLLVGQSGCMLMESIIESDPSMVLWWGTRVELASGACRLHREEKVNDKILSELLERIDKITYEADQIEPNELLRSLSIRLLRVHNLRAADALQLAAALMWTEYNPNKAKFVCLDKRLRDAAEQEGFSILPE